MRVVLEKIVPVDYAHSLSSLVGNSVIYISAPYFPTTRKDIVRLPFLVVCFDEILNTQEITSILRETNHRNATIHELANFVSSRDTPEPQTAIIALGTQKVIRPIGTYLVSPKAISKSRVVLVSIGDYWAPDTNFLVTPA